MKKILVTLFMAMSVMVTKAQESSTTYQAFNSSWYVYENEEWVLQTENKDVDISIVFYNNSINVQAKTPTLYKLKPETKKSIDKKNFYGTEFEGIECVNEVKCTVDYIYFRENSNTFLLSIFFYKGDKYVNFRYYCNLKN